MRGRTSRSDVNVPEKIEIAAQDVTLLLIVEESEGGLGKSESVCLNRKVVASSPASCTFRRVHLRRQALKTAHDY